MKISAMGEYACRALLELSLHHGDVNPMRIRDIAENQNIPVPYLVQIFQQLKRIGLVQSKRGAEGGYTLSRSPDKITFGEVIRAIDGPLVPLVCLNDQADKGCLIEIQCVFKRIWREVEQAMAKVVDNITFQEICDRVNK